MPPIVLNVMAGVGCNIISERKSTVGESGISVRKLLPSSQHLASNGSRGIEPKNSTFSSFDIACAPPVEAGNISAVFCVTEKSISFLTSKRATCGGVVTITAPVTPASLRYEVADRCSSDVPGGVSNTR
ncbi:hypothetical protein X777_12036 [Ooceraea biroi]|uniref:Uncharacterized protein n=1 Tax=Ooceraea biroi TaxID=2015173 RepID=A0A026X1Q8_OOCBI|nr:hypothetical protein X777_12036 [Ooceraea biroi]